mgnify:CR=1 FL=1
MKKQWIVNHEDELKQVAAEFIEAANGKRIFAFYGQMGSGKTTFIKSLCSYIGVADEMSSPTYNIVNVYKAQEKIYHMDLYRLNNFEEVWAIGIEDYLLSGRYCFIEWPQLIIHLLPSTTVNVQIGILQNGSRIISINL